MEKLEIKIYDPEGLHARPASRLVSLCLSFKSDIIISYGGIEANGKNITEVLALGAEKGDLLRVVISGSDEKEASSALEYMLSGTSAKEVGQERYENH
jgi:phosphocarrier protein